MEDLTWLVAVIFFIWSVALIWATWQIRCLARELDAERRELRRWARLKSLGQEQRHKWQ